MLSVKQGRTKYHFLSFWYDSIWDWTLVSRTIVQTTRFNKIPGLLRYFRLFEFSGQSQFGFVLFGFMAYQSLLVI